MRRRIIAATAGAAVASALAALALAASPWRPTGLLVGLLLVGVAAPAVAAGGAAAGMKMAGMAVAGPGAPRTGSEEATAGRGPSTLQLAALGTPISVLFALFVVDLIGVGGPGAQQGGALVLGSVMATGLAARFGDA